MAKYKVTLTTVVDFAVTVEADDEEKAIDKAYALAPGEAYGPDPRTMYALDLNSEWQLREPHVREITEE